MKDFTKDLFGIVSLVILYGLYKNHEYKVDNDKGIAHYFDDL